MKVAFPMSQTAAATNVVTLKTCVLKGFDYNNTDVESLREMTSCCGSSVSDGEEETKPGQHSDEDENPKIELLLPSSDVFFPSLFSIS
jgi:hypothetical protein